jgi:hypothetical protein
MTTPSTDGGYGDWDADNNDQLNQDEFNQSVANTGLYSETDADNNDQIDENEFSEATS